MPHPCECTHQLRVHNLIHCRKCTCTVFKERLEVCSVEGCDATVRNTRMCNAHVLRWRRHGDPLAGKPRYGTVSDRFWAKVEKTKTCWLWTDGKDRNGYARIKVNDRSIYVHRYAYEELVGPVPDGLDLDHLCRVTNCVRPDHLEPVTHRENMLRGVSPPAIHAAQTHCIRGHLLPPKRRCNKCEGIRERIRRAKRVTEIADEGVHVVMEGE